MKSMRPFFQQWGHYLLALMCVAAVLLSALWTRDEQRLEKANRQVHADLAQRMADVTPSPPPEQFQRPVTGRVIRSFSEEAVFFPQRRLYALHPSTDFAVLPGEKVLAAFDGKVTVQGKNLLLENEQFSLVYKGVEGEAKEEKNVKKGQVLGTATGYVPYEGENMLCLTLRKNGIPVNVESWLPSR